MFHLFTLIFILLFFLLFYFFSFRLHSPFPYFSISFHFFSLSLFVSVFFFFRSLRLCLLHCIRLHILSFLLFKSCFFFLSLFLLHFSSGVPIICLGSHFLFFIIHTSMYVIFYSPLLSVTIFLVFHFLSLQCIWKLMEPFAFINFFPLIFFPLSLYSSPLTCLYLLLLIVR